MRRLLLPVFRIAANVVMVLSVAGLLCFLIASYALGWQVDPVRGEGMSPAFHGGDAAVIEKSGPESITVGDVLVYYSPIDGQMTAHRVIDVLPTEEGIWFRTQADNLEEPDPYVVVDENVVGKALFHVPMMGHMADFMATALGQGLLLGVPGLIMITVEVNRLIFGLIPQEMRRRKAAWSTGLSTRDWIR